MIEKWLTTANLSSIRIVGGKQFTLRAEERQYF